MFAQVNEVAVLVAAILAIAVGSIWYSPLLFGSMWMRATGLTPANLDMPQRQMVIALLSALFANLVFLLAVAKFIDIARAAERSIWEVGLLILVVISAAISSSVIWEKRPISYLIINSGYTAIVVFGGFAVISLWPW